MIQTITSVESIDLQSLQGNVVAFVDIDKTALIRSRCIQKNRHTLPVEQATRSLIWRLQQRCAHFFYITARPGRASDCTLRQLKSLEIEPIGSALQNGIYNTACGRPYQIFEQVIFANSFEKGIIAKHTLQNHGISFDSLVVIDDMRANLIGFGRRFPSRALHLYEYCGFQKPRKDHLPLIQAIQERCLDWENKILTAYDASRFLARIRAENWTERLAEALEGDPTLLKELLILCQITLALKNPPL